MTSILHALNIGTLACWLSVVGFGAVAFVVPGTRGVPVPAFVEKDPPPFLEDFTLGESEEAAAESTEEASNAAPAETLPAPPELPEMADFAPLPEIPEIAAPPAKPAPAVAAAPPSAKPSATPGSENRIQRLRHRQARRRWFRCLEFRRLQRRKRLRNVGRLASRQGPHAEAELPRQRQAQRPDRHRGRRVHRGCLRPGHFRDCEILLRLAAARLRGGPHRLAAGVSPPGAS